MPQVSPTHPRPELSVAVLSMPEVGMDWLSMPEVRMDLLPSLVALTGLQGWNLAAELLRSQGGRRCCQIGWFEAAAAVVVVRYQGAQTYCRGIQTEDLMS